jgi:hypothetical protein
MNEQATLTTGTNVWTRDGEFIGTVAQVLGDYFQLYSQERGRHWFALSSVEADGQRATVDFDAGDLLASTVPAPDAYEESQYIESDERTEEQDEQREQVLRDLAEQRREISSEGALPAAERTVGESVEQELREIEAGEG